MPEVARVVRAGAVPTFDEPQPFGALPEPLGQTSPMSRSGADGTAPTRWRMVGVVVFCAAALLLISMGGAIIAAPLTIPLMFVVARRHPTSTFRAIGAVLAGATAAEVAWALTYVAADEAKPWIWLIPLIAAFATMAVFVITSDPAGAGARSRLTANVRPMRGRSARNCLTRRRSSEHAPRCQSARDPRSPVYPAFDDARPERYRSEYRTG